MRRTAAAKCIFVMVRARGVSSAPRAFIISTSSRGTPSHGSKFLRYYYTGWRLCLPATLLTAAASFDWWLISYTFSI